MAANKYEVVEYNSGGFFIHGGRLNETYVKRKEDADLICDALNKVERLKLVRTMRRVSETLASLEELNEALKRG